MTKHFITAVLIFSLAAALKAQEAEDLPALREQLARQEKQIEELRAVLSAQQKLLESLFRDGPHAALAPAQQIEPSSPPAKQISPLTVGAYSPLSFRIGAAEFTPGASVDLTSVFRSTNVGSGVGTAFGSIPFENTPAGMLTESRLSAQKSRVNLKVTSQFGKQKLTGYLETDFNGVAPGSLNVTSNSATMRLRLYWAQIVRGNWEFLGGQSWSMLTPNRVGISPHPSDLFVTQNLDSNYQVGLTWTRAPQFRAVYHATRNWTAGISLENPEQFAGPGVVLPDFAANQFDNGSQPGTPNVHPDVIGRIAFDGEAAGRPVHVEAAGLFRTFRSLRPGGGTSIAHGYSGSVNTNFDIVKNLRFVLTTFYGQGGGRYIYGLAPDAVVRADGTVSAVRSAAGIAGLEFKPTANWQLYGYYGGVYAWRNFSEAAPAQFLGFGFSGAPASANRTIQEATAGAHYTFWKDPNYGALQLLTQYSYVTRSPWQAPAGLPRRAHTSMVFVSLRYVLP
ncbi:MAG: hypothetical protein ACM3S5_14690 [Rhodospirillales bacterium]